MSNHPKNFIRKKNVPKKITSSKNKNKLSPPVNAQEKKKKFANWQCDCPKIKRGNVTGNGVTQKKRQKDSRKREEKKNTT